MSWSNDVKKFADSTISIDGKQFQVKSGELDQVMLRFYPDNPRVYTAIHQYSSTPIQSEIEEHMCELSHVENLKKRIVQHGGLLEAVIVKDTTFDVIEGNSRLAAYRLLKGKAGFQKMRVIVLPSDIEDHYIFSYLGNIHINGKTPWAAHEKARYLQREAERKDIKVIAKAIGLAPGQAEKLVSSIKLMQKYDDSENKHFSAYEALLSNLAAQKAIKEFPKFEKILVNEIIDGNFEQATEFRNTLTPVFSDTKATKSLLSGKYDLSDAFEYALTKGVNTEAGKKVKRASQAISNIERQHLESLTTKQLNQVQHHLKKIKQQTTSLLAIVDSIKEAL